MSPLRPTQIFVLIDALGWRILQGREFLPDILPYRTPLRTVLGFSSGAIPTILTGLAPSETGHWNLLYYDRQSSPFRWLKPFGILPEPVLNNRYTRKIMQKLGRRVLGLGPGFECVVSPRYLPYFNWVEKRNLYGCKGIAGAPSIFDDLKSAGIPFRIYSYHYMKDAAIFRQAAEDIRSRQAGVYFLYLCELDHFLHDHRAEPAAIDERVVWYGEKIRALYKLARGVEPEMGLTVFSDHGMAPVHQQYDLVREVEALGLRMPADYLAVYDSTMARFWFFSDRARESIMGCLQRCSAGRILTDEELRGHGVFFADRRFGELVFLLNAGWMMARSDFNGPRWNPAGMHGYHPDDPDSDAVFLSHEAPAAPLATIADVHRHMRSAVGLGVPA